MAGDSEQISQDEIEKLLSQSKAPASSSDEAGREPAAASQAAAIGDSVSRGEQEVEAVLQGSKRDAAAHDAGKSPASGQTKQTAPGSTVSGLPPSDIEFLFQQAEQALASVQGPIPTPPGLAPYKLVEFGAAPASTENATLDLLRDVELDLKIELGRTHMYLEDVLRLSKGAVVPLDRLAGDPVDIYVNGRLIARGEVLILNDNFCVRVAELVAGEVRSAQS
jgi:flagellar motor switch protein FliN